MKMHTGKIKAKGVVPHANGPTRTINDAAKFHGAGKITGKYENGVISQKAGAIFTENSTHIPSMNPSKHGSEKELKSNKSTVSIKEHMTTEDLTVTQKGSGEPTDRPYPLAKSYEKSGKTDRIPNRADR